VKPVSSDTDSSTVQTEPESADFAMETAAPPVLDLIVSPLSEDNKEPILKKTRFATIMGKDVCSYFERQHCLSREEVRKQWYSIVEIKAFRKICRKEAKEAKQSKQYMDSFWVVFDACTKQGGLKTKQEQQAAFHCAESKYRGLEPITFRDVIMLGNDVAIKGILEAQRELPTRKPGCNLTADLAATSRSLSEQSGLRARIMGASDAYVARLSCYDERHPQEI
jgi:hypothetical protein